ncbi:MAG: hypothetical protein IH831_10015 [Planctomycetes bacterium]|nr:hypothetical protein [Planctomycetota bacterium]
MTTRRHSNVVLLSVFLGIAAGAPVALAAPPIEWTIYRPSNTGILGTKARSLHVDGAGLVWIGASMVVPLRGTLGGISAFDGQQWQTVSRDDYPLINDPVIRDIVDDANGFRWMASEGGLLRYDLAAGPDSLVRFDPSNSPMPTEWVTDIALAPDGTIWLAMFRVTNPNRSGGLAKYDPATNTWQVWQASQLPWLQQFPSNGWVTDVAVTPDPGGGYTVWIGEFFDGSAEPETVHSRWRGLPGALMDDRQELVAALDREIKEQVAAGSGKLRFFLTQFKSIRNQLIESLRTVSRHLILKEIQELNKARLIGTREDPDAAERRELHRCVDAAMPPGSDESAVARLLLILPENMTEQCIPASLLKESNPPTTIVRGTGDDLIVCREVEGLHVQRVAASLVQYRRDYIEIAKRLHTRIDVDWIDMSADDPRKSGSMSYEP